MNATEAAYVEQLESSNEGLKSEVKSLENEVKHLSEQLEMMRRYLYGKRSEKYVEDIDANQLHFDGFEPTDISTEDSEKEVESKVKRQKKKKRHGKDKVTLPRDLPVEEVVIDLPAKEKEWQGAR